MPCIQGGNPAQVLFRAIGPELTNLGVNGALQDPTLDLYDVNGALLQSNDAWQDTQSAEIMATGLAPASPGESAILATLMKGGLHRGRARQKRHHRHRPRRRI
jgi:hypothetical protein